MADSTKRMSRRLVALLWLIGVTIVIGVIIYLEQIAVLYLLATLSLVVLLLIVAFSDLEHVDAADREGFASGADRT